MTRAGSVADARPGSGTPCVLVVTAPVSMGSDLQLIQWCRIVPRLGLTIRRTRTRLDDLDVVAYLNRQHG